ncbi:hypothetical protein [uncultured Draconibacterium sp.]|uniref:hypothetical protein n=1 Tax=uncultured Draconibacterium sp. TaxID=1573823 RepID=UPI0029C70D6C|nr:hypothetical protein [uncultured Draconibacterium sp.]
MENHVKTNIEVGGVILTDSAIAQLSELQQHDNESIRMCRENIADAICLLTLLLDHYPHEPTKQKAVRSITDLSYIREHFENIQKP